MHDLALKITEIYFQEKLLCNFLVKMEIAGLLGLILEISMYNSSKYSWSNDEVFDAKRISYSELDFASRILHNKFMLHDLWCNVLMLHGC